MKISLKPARGEGFVFSVMPEQIRGRDSARYQSYDIISKGEVKVPKGTAVSEISWDGEFFGKTKKNEALVKTKYWKPPNSCVKKLKTWMRNKTELTLIVSGTWINVDVTIASFETVPYGAFGNVKYSITFCVSKDLKIHTTQEEKIGRKKKTKPRARKKADSSNGSGGSTGCYVVKKGDTLIGIANKKGCKWQALYNKNKTVIERVAKKRGMGSSDHGHWIFPGTKLTIP